MPTSERGWAMRRRAFLGVLVGTAAWPLAAHAQQTGRVRRIGVLISATEGDANYEARLAAFLQGLQQLGWTVGRNIQIDYRWGGGSASKIRTHAMELAALAPDIILADGASTVGPMLQATRTVPVVFTTVVDPVGAGFVGSL